MKNIVKFTTVVAFMFATVAGMANEPKVSVISLRKDRSVVLKLDASSENVSIRLKDEQLNTIYSENLSKGSYNKKLNMSDLEDGVYFLSTEDKFKTYSYTIEITGEVVKLVATKEADKPYFRKTSEKVFVNFLNLDNSNVSLKVYDEEYRLVYTETIKDTFVVEKAFNFEDAVSGTYTVVVSNDANTFVEEFVVN
ncbi:hypothetical protein ACOCEA_12375 [Maribacter sp. CXY002]|uniref:hypothetical protein n=1 Tax=Maribacter luteocoastalis TaxID=3407671 RepID=UPI003B683474